MLLAKRQKKRKEKISTVWAERGKKRLYLVWREMIFLLIPTNGTENKIKR